MWWVCGLLGGLAVASTALPLGDAAAVSGRALPVLGFLVALTALAGLADEAGLFDAAATAAARIGRGRTWLLFLLVAAVATATTVLLSLDTTAVLVTPVVLVLTRRLGLAPLPFAVATVWLANSASLLLPVSNLTNLLALSRLQLSQAQFSARQLLPQLVAVAVTVAVLLLRFRTQLAGGYRVPTFDRPVDPALFRAAACGCGLVAPAVLAGGPPWLVTGLAAAVLLGLFAVRRPASLSGSLVPWRLVVLVEGLFLFVSALGRHGLDHALSALAGHSDSLTGLLRTSVVAASASNAVNNLPAYLALDHALPGHRPLQLLAVLVGTNAAPLLVLHASVATLLWRQACRRRGLSVSPIQFARLGVLVVPVLLAATTATLWAGGNAGQ